jgi:hypothetical protein
VLNLLLILLSQLADLGETARLLKLSLASNGQEANPLQKITLMTYDDSQDAALHCHAPENRDAQHSIE